MLVQLYRDNYIETAQEELTFRIYNGYFNGTDASPNITWFNTAVLLIEGTTANLTDLQTATKNQFGDVDNKSLKVFGYFRAKKTGVYTFYTTSDDASFLYINDILIISNGGTHNAQTRFGVYYMTAGSYYKFDIYYGESAQGQEFSAGYYEPDLTVVPDQSLTGATTTIMDGIYPGNYVVSSSSFLSAGSEPYRAFDKSLYSDTAFCSIGSIYSKTIGGYSQYYADAGTATTSIVGGGTYRGEWLQIELPKAIRIKHFKMNRRSGTGGTSNLPDLYALFGTNDTTQGWYKLYERSSPGNAHWGANVYEVKSFNVATNENEYKYYRMAVYRTQTNSAMAFGELLLYTEIPPAVTTNFIKDGTGLTTYYNINPENTTTLVETTANYPLLYLDASLQGLFKVSVLAMYSNRTNFTTSKHDILYIASDDLFNNFNGTYRNYIQIHEKPVANDNERKRFTQFSDDMSFKCELDGKIEVRFRRGTSEPVNWRYAMLILDVERIPVTSL
jgi:hypothetical protein